MIGSHPGHCVEFAGASACYRGVQTLKNITLGIEPGQIVGVSGPNGSGKTALLRVIQGLLHLSGGSARIFGLDLVPSNHTQVRRRTACVFQTLSVDPRMPITAGEVVMMGRYGRMGLLRGPTECDRRAVCRALELSDAMRLSDRPFGQLSGGEQQRINLARALAQEPDLLLLDEPTTFLDSESQQRVREIVKTVHRELKLTTIIVSHDADMLRDLCERIVMMERGRVVRIVPSMGYADA